MTSTTELDASAVLSAARRARIERDAADARVLEAAVEWARLHEVIDPDLAATFWATPVLIAGEGAPMIASEAIAEFAAVIGLSTNAGRSLIGEAIELAHRLPRTFARVQEGFLVSWRARRIAAVTLDLSPEAASYVDQQVARFAHKISVADTQRLIDTATTLFMPEFAAERRDAANEGRHFSFNHNQVSFAGTTCVWGELDMADALDLDAAIATEAAALKELGNEQPLDVRRATAAGNLARGQLTMDTSLVEEGRHGLSRNPAAKRDVTIYVHLTPDTEVARVENAGTHLVTKDQVAQWIGTTGTRVFIRPVIDLNKPINTTAYQVPDRIREHLILRDRTCVFPNCTWTARSCDADHVVAYDDGGQTSTDNLAPLCRYHHRLKTHTGWTYTIVEPGVYLWRSPHGYQFLRDRDGTELVTPQPVEPPGG